MICLISPSDDPFLNLALEEHLLREGSGEVFLLWQSRPAVVVGKHQNALGEINHGFVRENRITVARRLSGGGTVFHGPGNLNFTFIRNGAPGKLVDFRRFIAPITGYLASLGVEAVQGPKHEILVSGKKISGNAEHVYRNRVLHHGTLLFQADLTLLQESIRVKTGRYIDKAVQSNRSEVMNLSGCLSAPLSLDAFRDGLLQYVCRTEGGTVEGFDGVDMEKVRQLADNKYNTWDWIYGWSPDYTFVFEENAVFTGTLSVHRGRITHADLHSSQVPGGVTHALENALAGCRHEVAEVEAIIAQTVPHQWGTAAALSAIFF
jgi:lipoate-protein ligase A